MFALHFLDLYTKRARKRKPKKDLQQNTMCLEQQIYDRQESFTQPLVVMVETFRRTAEAETVVRYKFLVDYIIIIGNIKIY